MYAYRHTPCVLSMAITIALTMMMIMMMVVAFALRGIAMVVKLITSILI